ncbi:MAG: DUF2333 family protein [Pseudomonadota bacterium]
MEQPPGENRLETFLLDSAARPRRGTGRWLPRILLVLGLLALMFGGWWSREPAVPDGRVPPDAAPGVAVTAALVATVRTLLEKPGGFLANDALPPGVLLDNMPAFENGALAASRTLLRALRRDFSRAQTQSVEDPDLLRAEPRLNFDSGSWLVPSAESEYGDALAALENYLARLQMSPPGARFQARADNLGRWLDEVGAQLDEQGRLLATARHDTPWLAIDDRFYFTRGYCWALRAQLLALRRDFATTPALDAGFAAALHALDGTQQPVTSPLILNGGEYGVLANHSLVMAGHVGRVAAALRQLRVPGPAGD